MTADAELALYIERLPWLAELGPQRLEELDRGDWQLPSETAAIRLRSLGEALGVNLMVYRRGSRSEGAGLCSTIMAASLSDGDLVRLGAAEEDQGDHVLVAYQRPLLLNHPTTSRPERSAEPESQDHLAPLF